MKKKTKIINIENMGEIEFSKLKCNNRRKFRNPIKHSRLLKKVNSNEIQEFVNNKYVLEMLLKDKIVNVYSAHPKNLLSPHRFDVLIKYMYVEALDKNKNLDKAKEIYLEHIGAFNNFCEPDGDKRGKEEFLNYFNKLIDNMKENGFKDSYIPVSRTGEIIDGAHRLAIALYYGIEVKFILLNVLDANYNYDFFLKRNLKKESLKSVIKYLLEQEEWALVVTTNILKIKNKVDVYYENAIDNAKHEHICLIRSEDAKRLKNEKIYFGKDKLSVLENLKGDIYE